LVLASVKYFFEPATSGLMVSLFDSGSHCGRKGGSVRKGDREGREIAHVGGADLTVLVGELEGLDETDGLVNGAADGKVVDGDLAEGLLGVDEEETAESDTSVLRVEEESVWMMESGKRKMEGRKGKEEKEKSKAHLDEDAVVARDLVVGVGNKLKLEVRSETTLVAVGVGESKVRVLRVGRNGEDLNTELLELVELLVEGEDLGGADEGDCGRKNGREVSNLALRPEKKGEKNEGNVQSRG
jgi:hypothetical protein